MPCPKKPAAYLHSIYNASACLALPRTAWQRGQQQWSRDMRDDRNRAIADGLTPRDFAAILQSTEDLEALGFASFSAEDFEACRA